MFVIDKESLPNNDVSSREVSVNRECSVMRMDEVRTAGGRVEEPKGVGSSRASDQEAEIARRRAEERFHKIFQFSNDAIFVIDPEADAILDVNGKACSMLGYTREELLSLPVSAIHPDEMPALLAFARSVFEKGSGWTQELTCLTKVGERLPAEISASVMDMAGRPCLIALVRDISGRKRAEAELKRYSEDLYRLVGERSERLHEVEERQRVLLEINNAIISYLDRESLFDAIGQALHQVLPFDRAGLTLLDRARDVVQVYALAGILGSERFFAVGTELPREGHHLAQVFDQMRPLIRRDLEKEIRIGAEDRLLSEGIRSYIAVPLMAKGEAFGSLNLASRSPDRYSERDADFLMQVGQQVALAVENMLAYEEIAGLKSRLEQENIYLQEEIRIHHSFEEILGESPAIKNVLKAIETVAPTDAHVVIMGETGTGKELVARAIHRLSPRRDKTLIKVNCAAIPRDLFESEFFGHVKGAFTGALKDRVGRFQLADGGTLFLDEVTEIPLDMQSKLLRVLQEGEYERVGEEKTRKVDVRIIAATNRDLRQEVEAGRFRQDLYYRLNVFPIEVAPLKRRKEDIPLLVTQFLEQAARQLNCPAPRLTQADVLRLQAYDWPGNVRELQNVIERAVITSRCGPLQFDLPPGEIAPPTATRAIPAGATGPDVVPVGEIRRQERQNILAALQRTRWKIHGPGGAAELLGIKPTTLASRIKKLGLKKPQ